MTSTSTWQLPTREGRRRALLAAVGVASVCTAGVVLAAEAATCPSWTDPAGDSGPGAGAVPVGDKDLDLVAAQLRSTPEAFTAAVSVVRLGAAGPNPQSGSSDQFTVRMTVDGVEGEVTAKRDSVTGLRSAYLSVGGTAVAATAVYDLDKSTVVITTSAAEAARAAGKAIDTTTVVPTKALSASGTQDVGLVPYDEAAAPSGVQLKGFCGTTPSAAETVPTATATATATTADPTPSPTPDAPFSSATPSSPPSETAAASPSPGAASPSPDGTAATADPSAEPTAAVTTAPSRDEARLALSAATRVAYGDPLRILVSLRTSDGMPLGARQVTADFASSRTAGRTAADGYAALALPALRAAGRHTVTARWAGDALAGPAARSLPVEIVRERVAVRVTARNVDGQRLAVLTVRDDDGALVRGGGVLTVYVDGTRRGTARLDSTGRATWPVAPGSAVTATYPGAAGTYLPARGSGRV